MVKVLENRAVDLDIVPGTKDSGDLKKQADAATYAAPPLDSQRCFVLQIRMMSWTIADSLSVCLSVVKRQRTSLPKLANESKASRKVPRALAPMPSRLSAAE